MERETSSALLTERQASQFLGAVAMRTLQAWRRQGRGPAYVKLGRRVAYAIADLEAFKAAGRVQTESAAEASR